MSKKQYLELLIKTFGLTPIKVKSYRTSSGGGQYNIGVGWEIVANDRNDDFVFEIITPEGFNDAVREVIKKCTEEGLKTFVV